MKTSLMASAPSRSRTHPNLPRRITHPDIPQREGTSYYALSKTSSDNHISPHLASPVGEGQILLLLINH